MKAEGQEGKAKERKDEIFRLAGRVIGCAMKVHSHLGPGLLESAYEACLCRSLSIEGLAFAQQKDVPIQYEGLDLDCGFRLDLLVEGKLVVEVKATSALLPLHRAQLLTYLRLSRRECGLLINFNTVHLRDGIRRIAP